MQRLSRFLIAFPLILIVGCASAPKTAENEHLLRKAESECERLEKLVKAREAETIALRESLATEQSKCEREKASLDNQVEALQEKNAALVDLMERHAAESLTRPDINASPLPPEIDRAMRNFANSMKDRVKYDRPGAKMTFLNDRLFASGSDTVRPDAVAAIIEFGKVLGQAINAHPEEKYDVVVVGHTDDQPIRRSATKAAHPTNWHLSVHRAIGVKNVLIKAGVPESRIGVMGYSSFRPVNTDRAANRRVEIYLIARGKPMP